MKSRFTRPGVPIALVDGFLHDNDVQTSDDLCVLRVPELVSDLALGSIPKENAFP